MAENTEEASNEEAPTEAPKYSGATAMGVMHEVSDVAAWKAVYDEVSDPDSRLGYVQSTENPNLLFVFEWTTSHDEAKASMGSEEIKAAMERAGVTSEPTVTLYDMKYFNQNGPGEGQNYRVAANHEVADFAAWKEKFDADAENRTNAGMTLLGMATSPENANMVYMVFAVSDLEKVGEMMGSDEMKAKMEEAGVVGEPTITTWVAPAPADNASS